METKLIALILCDLLGITGLGNGIINRIDSWKEAIIFILAALYALARVVFYIIRSYQAVKKEAFEQTRRERGTNGHHQSR